MPRAVVGCLALAFLATLSMGAVNAQSQPHSAGAPHQGAPHEKVFLLRGFTNVLSSGKANTRCG